MSNKQRVTQAMIAQKLGISQSAVSLTLKDPQTSRVSAANRERIMDFLRERAPDMIPRRAIRTLCFLMPANTSTSNPFYTRFLQGVEEECGRGGQHLLFKRWSTPDDVTALIDLPVVEGFIHFGYLPPEIINDIRGQRPIVVANHLYDHQLCDQVTIDNHGGIRQAMGYLHELGHRRIAYVGPYQLGKENRGHSVERFGAYMEGLCALGLPIPADYVAAVCGDGGRTGAIQRLFGLEDKPTAIVAFNDSAAIAAINQLSGMGFSVPDDVSIVGFDNTPEAASWPTPLTSIHQDREQMGRLAVHILRERLEQASLELTRKILCRTELIVRASVKRIDKRN